jgi:hypothetical protein
MVDWVAALAAALVGTDLTDEHGFVSWQMVRT